jgi:hypothetical protein
MLIIVLIFFVFLVIGVIILGTREDSIKNNDTDNKKIEK